MADFLFSLAAILTCAAFVLALYRFLKGPSVASRVVAFDVLTIVSVTALVQISFAEGRGIYLDVALVYALLSFLGVIVIARYLERGF